MGPPHKIPISVLVVIYTAAHEVLLLERAGQPGFWQSVTGSLDAPDEALRDAAIREVEEETGLQVGQGRLPADALQDWGLTNVYEIYPIWRHRYAPGVTHNTEHVFGLILPERLPIRLSAREHRAMCWHPDPLSAADRCFSPSNAEAILHLRD